MKVTDAEGKELWICYVEGFEDRDSFKDGEIYNPQECARTLEELLIDDSEHI
jgi:hypothetical protein